MIDTQTVIDNHPGTFFSFIFLTKGMKMTDTKIAANKGMNMNFKR